MDDFIKKLKNIEIQGAVSIALASLEYLKSYSKRYGFGKKFDDECEKILKARPTAVPLFNVISELKKEKSEKKIDEIIEKIKLMEKKIPDIGEKIIKNNYVVHTHCHSSEALSVIKEAAKKKKFTVVVDETRPKEQGIKTAKELSKIKNIRVILITDDAAGIALSPFIPPNDDVVIVGADCLRKEGIVNKIGTYILAVCAKENKVPFYVVASTLKLDRRKKIIIEKRPASEVYRKLKSVEILNYAFDITPWKYITAVITEKGIMKPRKIINMIR